ncbi:MAG: tRNA (N6-isopentenyl adenosine(37)-C2)-methylthiotransferase MiaB [Lachnospiraceae bacterium]|jgi:tRNA-2-methylthio-N6-dimethylallyladenosine synthase
MTDNFRIGAENAAEAEKQRSYMAKCRELIDRRAAVTGRRMTFKVNTFGCQMNAKDSEKLEGILEACGLVKEADEKKADFNLFNTCTVRENASEKLYGHLGLMKSLKEKDPGRLVGVCGCMMQEKDEAEKMRSSYPFVDLVFGTHNISRLAELLYRTLTTGKQVREIWDGTDEIVEDLPQDRKYPFKAGVNITYGCDNFCTYCIVPYVRGRERSRNPRDILRECEKLASEGVKEVMLLGQNVNSYGKGLEGGITFAELLREVCRIDGIERIRFMTSHPKDLSDELIEVMAQSDKICRHLHLPLQSGSSRILQRMNRHYTRESYLALTEKLRAAIPDLALTTDIIVGFPGETEEDFQATLDVVRTVRYSSAFMFIYSPRRGTPAASFPDQVPADVTHERFDRLLALEQKIAAEECGKDAGKTLTALVEEVNPKDPSLVTGRLSNNLMVHFPGEASLVGQIVPVRLLRSGGFYYMGEMAGRDGSD